MPLIDERSRVIGRFNVVDVAIAALIVLMIPVAYGAYVLFREPPAKLTAISPTVISSGPNSQMRIQGENLRPYMRVSFGVVQGPTFMFGSPTSATVDVPNLPPGKYDVELYDYAQEVSRLKDALTVIAPQYPQVTVQASGAFIGLTHEQIATLASGAPLPESKATIVQLDQPREAVARVRAGNSTFAIPMSGQDEVPASLSMPCDIRVSNDGLQHCFVGGVALAPDAVVTFGSPANSISFRVSELRYPGRSTIAKVRVRFMPRADLRRQMKVNDRDIGAKAFPNGAMATIESLGAAGGETMTAALSMQVEETPTGWTYKGRLVKVGSPILFETMTYSTEGVIVDVQLPDQSQ